ncbi:MAG: hypothetical protein QM708_09975 [Propioniciclava sp.]|uniref:hypothetical protein n=1 Tax=Propioniciclava sp. TaxID=2038686 RepID=UPI0039E32EC9
MAMTLRLSPDQTERLRRAAAHDGLSMQAAAIKAVDEYASRRTRLRDELLAEIIADDAGVIQRLAQ